MHALLTLALNSRCLHTHTSIRTHMHIYSQIHMVANSKTGKPRGYAFIEYEKERDMHGEL